MSAPNKEKISEDGQNERVIYGACSMQGWRVNMEDSHLAQLNFNDKNHCLFAVFDGHGGAEVAKFCSKYFVSCLVKNQNYISENYKKALEETFILMDQMLLGDKDNSLLKEFKVQAEGGISLAGCTANVCLVTEKQIYVANAGDSRALIFRKSQVVDPLSFDHKPDNELEKKRIKEAGGHVNDGRVNDNLNLSRAIGDLEYKRNPDLPLDRQIITSFPDIEVREIEESIDFILMGCDGIWETLSGQEICEGIKQRLDINKSIKLSAVLEDLLDKLIAQDTVEGTGCDNMTAVIFRFK